MLKNASQNRTLIATFNIGTLDTFEVPCR